MSRTMVALDFSKKEDVMNFLDKFDKPIYVRSEERRVGKECRL